MAEDTMVASAERLKGANKVSNFGATAQPWQATAWDLYGKVGEFKSATTWISNALSQIRAVPVVWDDGMNVWVHDDDRRATQVLAMLGDQTELMKMWGTNSVVAGEAVLVRSNGRYSLQSRSEIVAMDGAFYLDRYGSTKPRARRGQRAQAKPGPVIDDAWRIFLPHPRYTMLADTPVSSFLTDLEQLWLLRLVLNAKLNARIWMNGIWVFGQSVSLPAQTSSGTPGRESKFLTSLRELVQTNMKRKQTAADVAPIFMQVSTSEVGDVVKQFYPEVEIDAREAELRREIRNTLRELLDLPVEMQTSLGDANHWGAWSITDVNKIYSLMPRANALLSALSGSWYQAMLVENGLSEDEARRRRLIPNLANLEGEASSDEARQAWDRGLTNDTYARARSRIPEDAAPSEDEYVRNIGRTMKDPYLATWGLDVHNMIDWSKVAVSSQPGPSGPNNTDPERAPGVGDPGSPTDPNSEVQDPG